MGATTERIRLARLLSVAEHLRRDGYDDLSKDLQREAQVILERLLSRGHDGGKGSPPADRPIPA